MVVSHHPEFIHLRTHRIAHLDMEFQEYQHRVTGARHIHLAHASDEHVFLVAFRTMPMNSTGVAHVLEHTVLCGSRAYPVRDPFFMMIRRSLNTFMNAMTAGDWTAYPFATQNSKDFYNLLDVYLDAVFHPRLHPLDFAQEGIRVEVENGSASKLVYKGVVYNEMKGALSSPVSQLYESINKYLFPTTTYHFNSGGDPVHIRDLTHDDLLAFHAHHYHPSNAIFMSFGSLDVQALQQRIQDQALHEFSASRDSVHGQDEKRYLSPLRIEEAYPLDEHDVSAKTHIVLGWLLGPASHLEHALDMSLLSGILLNHAASPLRHALESTELATSASPLCGLADGARELVFMAGVEGSEPQHAEAIETLILEVLNRVVSEGIDPEEAESVLHQIELNEREIGGDRYPYGLSLLMNLLSPALQDADPLPLLDINPELKRLRECIKDRFYVAGLVRRWLLDNPHRVRLSLRPDREMSARAREQEESDLLKISAQMTEQQQTDLIASMEALAERQSQCDDEDCLPRVGRADIPPALPEEPAVQVIALTSGLSLGRGYAGTNGLVYQRIVMDMPVLDARLLPWLPFYKSIVTELGAGQEDYLSRQRRLAACTGGLALSEVAYTSPDNQQQAGAYLMLMGKALTRHQSALSELMLEQLEALRLDEAERIHELFQQMRLRWDHSVTHDGHQLAMGRAAASMSTLAAWRASQRGLLGLRFVREQDRRLAQDEESLEAMIQSLQAIHQAVLSQGRQIFWVGEAGQDDEFIRTLQSWSQPKHPGSVVLPAMAIHTAQSEAWLTQTQVQFCAQSYPAVPPGHRDAAALRLLGPLLRNLYLHSALRERGGAYGGGATYVADDAAFHLHSYRDPRFEGTLDDFQSAIDGIIHQAPTEVQLEEALLAVIASMDKPSSPAGSVLQVLTGALTGRDRVFRSQMRNDLLQVTVADIQRVAQTYLQADKARRVVIMPAELEQRARDRGFTIETLL